ncbi:MAG: hypothetical protein LV479_03170 [Methylacidiphilales bacterium]|nr:hypothetical protein [Candidatus Methylacidiphilales bacterium]
MSSSALKPNVETRMRPGVQTAPRLEYRVRILRDTILSREVGRDALNRPKFKGEQIFKGSVIDVFLDQWPNLRDTLSAVRVDDTTPLFDAQPALDPSTQRPARFLELVGNGLNSIADLATELATTKATIASIASKFIADGALKVNDRGLYVLAKKA